MELSQNTFEDSTQEESTHTPLISGLPDEIALLCLARVPRRYHHLLKCVSRRWRTLVCSEEWCSFRRKHSIEEAWIYALCTNSANQTCCYLLDPLTRCWKRIQDIPTRCLKRKGMAFEAIGKKLYLLGGCGWLEDRTNEVYCYDASTNTWAEAAPLSTARCYFQCTALNEELYTVGGIGLGTNELSSWDTYNPNSNSWTSHKDPNIFPEVEESLALDGQIYIRGGSSITPPRAVFYDSTVKIWQPVDNSEMVWNWRGPAVAVDGRMYVLDQISGLKLMMWKKENKEWVVVGRLSTFLARPPCQIVAVGRSIYVIGRGLSTVVVDIDKVGNVGGVMVSSSIPKLDSNVYVICCKTLSI
ncbi:SKP1 interacting partner 4 isoform X2 [Tasmannia lanceolata]